MLVFFFLFFFDAPVDTGVKMELRCILPETKGLMQSIDRLCVYANI